MAFHVAFGQPSSPILHLAPAVFWLGYRPVVADEARIATATARSQVWCATIPRRRVRAMLDAKPQWWRHFVTLSLEYGDTAAMSGADLLISNAEARLIAVLLRFAGLRGPTTNNTVLVPVTQQELASATNLSRNWTGRILRKLAGTDGSKPDTTDYSFVIQLNCAVF
ncbi:Crp/Fnr family transcriptional regulator [Ruegeria profundi]|uniref:Crp/Fnr family transcriptional regulator n=1 Tax=Ruegeria profundi TaxID=1685378 RepID=UPI001CD40446|nr:helix-turn-helix domain-containing protein [Ruegeria profundi]MCA0927078.1 helix-turn-helix domain-containing protein [Ruegeria profundi]